MRRDLQLLVRAAVGGGMLLAVVQCGGKSDQSATPTTLRSPTSQVAARTADTTAPATTAAVAGTTTIQETTTTVAPEPTTTTPAAPVIDPNCPTTAHAAVVDRDRQRAWLCDNGVALPEFVVTTARSMPDPGVYPVYAKDMNTSSTFGGHYSTMTHFVAFTRGKNTGARIAFHTVPVLRNGEFVQPLESVGTEERFGDSAGCIRVLPEEGPVIWDWLQQGDEVRILT
ncbi:MAG TPA: L,D-transpeptidase [Ilumatobacteraceae bacterium]|jgi:hypothetical protein